MTEAFRQFVNRHHLFTRDQRVLLTVSGGIDSVVMAHLFHTLNLNFGIAHCNFGLRGADSDGDQFFVEQLALRYGCPFHTVKFETHSYAVSRGLSTQMAARELRYQWFGEIRQQQGYHLIASAHHAGDDAETFFINLMRGTGIRGLQAIPLRQGFLIRPLKFATRSMIAACAAHNGLEWREDATNARTDYLRNKIRHHLMPLIEEISPGFAEKLTGTIARLTETTVAMDEMVALRRQQLVIEEDSELSISIQHLQQLHPAGFWIFELLHPYGFTPAVLADLERALAEPSGQRFFSASYQAWLKGDKLLVFPGKCDQSPEEFLIVSPDESASLPVRLTWQHVGSPQQVPQNLPKTEVWFDAEKLHFPLTLRRWRKGDRFRPFGLNGSKKVSDYFVDEKFTPWQKANTWLLCSGGRIAWIVGFRADDRFKVVPGTRQVLILRLAEFD